MRISNLKFINTTMFVFAFIIGGLFFNIQNVSAIITTSSAILNGSTSATVTPGATISVALTVGISAASNEWHSTSYAIDTSFSTPQCKDTTNYGGIGTYTENFTITAPLNPGTYNAYFQTKSTNICSGATEGTILTLLNAITVAPTATLNTIAITTNPAKLSYTVGESLDLTGLTVTGTYSDGTTKVETVRPENVSGFNSTVASPAQTITITLGGKTTTYNISINTPSTPDSVAITFDTISSTLNGLGITSNVGDVDSINYKAFTGLYFEKSIDGVKMGKITFTGSLDLSNIATQNFLTAIGSKLDMSKTGTIGLDFTDSTPLDLTDDPSLKNANATIKFYNLDKLGFTVESTASEILSLLIAMDDAGVVINKADLLTGSVTYTAPVGACMVGGDCYTFEVPVLHFTKYIIPENSIVKENTNNTSSNGSSGSYIQPIATTITVLPKLISCAPLSGHLYDVNTGKLCTNDTSIPMVIKEIKVEVKKPTVSILAPVKQVEEISPISNEPIEEIQGEEDGELSGRQELMSSLSASAGKVGKVFKGPMILWIILILIAILLGGGYGIYSLLKKDKETKEVKKVVNNTVPATPIIPVNKTPVQETLPMNNSVKENPNTSPVSNGTGPNTAK